MCYIYNILFGYRAVPFPRGALPCSPTHASGRPAQASTVAQKASLTYRHRHNHKPSKYEPMPPRCRVRARVSDAFGRSVGDSAPQYHMGRSGALPHPQTQKDALQMPEMAQGRLPGGYGDAPVPAQVRAARHCMAPMPPLRQRMVLGSCGPVSSRRMPCRANLSCSIGSQIAARRHLF